MWARRSGVDHSLGMGEAPGSNPGESIQRHLRQQPTKSTDGVDGDVNTPSQSTQGKRYSSNTCHPKGRGCLSHSIPVMRLRSMYGFAGNKNILIPANSCRLFALENLSFPMAILQTITPRHDNLCSTLTVIINFLIMLISKNLYSRERH